MKWYWNLFWIKIRQRLSCNFQKTGPLWLQKFRGHICHNWRLRVYTCQYLLSDICSMFRFIPVHLFILICPFYHDMYQQSMYKQSIYVYIMLSVLIWPYLHQDRFICVCVHASSPDMALSVSTLIHICMWSCFHLIWPYLYHHWSICILFMLLTLIWPYLHLFWLYVYFNPIFGPYMALFISALIHICTDHASSLDMALVASILTHTCILIPFSVLIWPYLYRQWSIYVCVRAPGPDMTLL